VTVSVMISGTVVISVTAEVTDTSFTGASAGEDGVSFVPESNTPAPMPTVTAKTHMPNAAGARDDLFLRLGSLRFTCS
jgi:hypothetical protein